MREWVEKSNIENRDGILSIINSSLAPDPRDAKIRSTYPKQYAFLLANVYPALRHSDYKIDYTIRSYSDPKEIIEVLYTRPQNSAYRNSSLRPRRSNRVRKPITTFLKQPCAFIPIRKSPISMPPRRL